MTNLSHAVVKTAGLNYLQMLPMNAKKATRSGNDAPDITYWSSGFILGNQSAPCDLNADEQMGQMSGISKCVVSRKHIRKESSVFSADVRVC